MSRPSAFSSALGVAALASSAVRRAVSFSVSLKDPSRSMVIHPSVTAERSKRPSSVSLEMRDLCLVRVMVCFLSLSAFGMPLLLG